MALRRVVIYRNGVGYFERAGHVDQDKVKFRVRGNEIGDFLATFAVIEAGGSSVRSASFPMKVEPERLDPPPTPMAAEVKGKTEPPPEKLQNVIMELDGKNHDLAVGYIAETPVWRPSYRLVIDKEGAVLQAWGIVQNLSGEDWKNVRLSLIAEAPLAFQAALAKAVIPARPEISDGGDVIAVVPQSETTLAQAPPPPPSPAPAAEVLGGLGLVGTGSGGGGSGEGFVGAPSKARVAKKGKKAEIADNPMEADADMAAAPAAPAPRAPSRTRNLSALAAVAVESGATRYDINSPVTIPDQSATMVLLLDRKVPGEAVALYAPDPGVPESSSHPFRVARFTNKTGGLLERGPLAIFAEGSFVGQGMTDALPDGATATVPFALERSLAVEQGREWAQEGARIFHVEAGALQIAREAVTRTKYKVRNGAEREAKLLLKHPRMAGTRLNQPPAGTEDNVGTGSALVPATLRGRDTVTVTVDERQQTTQHVDWLAPLADQAVQAYMADPRANQVAVAQLRAAWQIRKTLVKAVEERRKLTEEEMTLRKSTEETRGNLKALEKNTAAADLRARLTSRLAADSARLDVVLKKEVEVDLAVNEQRVRFTEAVRAIKVLEPLPLEG